MVKGSTLVCLQDLPRLSVIPCVIVHFNRSRIATTVVCEPPPQGKRLLAQGRSATAQAKL